MRTTLGMQALRAVPARVRLGVRFSRRYNGHGEPKTYFQAPPPPPRPPRRILSTTLVGLSCLGIGAYAHAYLYGEAPFQDAEAELNEGEMAPGIGLSNREALATAVQDAHARATPPLDLDQAQTLLDARAVLAVTSKTIAHVAQLPSNLPCEDAWSHGVFNFFPEINKNWNEWGIFDGHRGPRTSNLLGEFLPRFVGDNLWEAGCLERPYTPNDRHIINTIKKAFLDLDSELCDQAVNRIRAHTGNRTYAVANAAAAFSGSCALMALYDPVTSVLRVANTGDSRAVLGRWDEASKRYVAHSMSVDQTGRNPAEIARLQREHPGEEVPDPKTHRILGYEPSRAFGDVSCKWPSDLLQRAHELFWGHYVRPQEAEQIKTPPYLTAEPEIMETRTHEGDHPDFLIMASDGLWDKLSSEDAVNLVQLWLGKNKPTDAQIQKTSFLQSGVRGRIGFSPFARESTSESSALEIGVDDTYYDEEEKALLWRVSPKHFIVEDEHCGVHLIKNALGGNRRNLFLSVMSVQCPLSRSIRDDITVQVIFFGVNNAMPNDVGARSTSNMK